MKYSLVLFLILIIPPLPSLAAKSQKNTIIDSSSQFQNWCKTLSYRHFKRKKQQAYNWSASTIRQLNDYQTSGSWKVDNVERDIYCQIRIGKKAKYTQFEIR